MSNHSRPLERLFTRPIPEDALREYYQDRLLAVLTLGLGALAGLGLNRVYPAFSDAVSLSLCISAALLVLWGISYNRRRAMEAELWGPMRMRQRLNRQLREVARRHTASSEVTGGK